MAVNLDLVVTEATNTWQVFAQITGDTARKREAMAAYASQEERHPYWNAGLSGRSAGVESVTPAQTLGAAALLPAAKAFEIAFGAARCRQTG